MTQDLIAQQEMSAGGGNGGTAFGFVTGATCTSSGTYRCSNKYMDLVLVYAAGDVFFAGPDGKKTTWYALAPNLSTKDSGGGFRSVKVEAGAI